MNSTLTLCKLSQLTPILTPSASPSQKSLHASTSGGHSLTPTSAETLVLLLDAYSACLCAETNGHDRARARATDKSSSTTAITPEVASDGDFSTLPVPELLAWVNDGISGSGGEGRGEYGKMMYPEVHAALMRCMGRMAAACTAPPGAGSAVSTHKRRVLANVITEGPLGMMVEAAYGSSGVPAVDQPSHAQPPHHHPAVTATAAVALWSVMHHSEQARAVARALLASAAVSVPLPSQPSAMVVGEKAMQGGGSMHQITHRAQHAVALMLQ